MVFGEFQKVPFLHLILHIIIIIIIIIIIKPVDNITKYKFIGKHVMDAVNICS